MLPLAGIFTGIVLILGLVLRRFNRMNTEPESPRLLFKSDPMTYQEFTAIMNDLNRKAIEWKKENKK